MMTMCEGCRKIRCGDGWMKPEVDDLDKKFEVHFTTCSDCSRNWRSKDKDVRQAINGQKE